MAAKKKKYPVLPLRDIVVYPKMIVPLFVGRDKSIRALQSVVDSDGNIILATQKEAAIEDPQADDIYDIGTLGTVVQMLKLPDGTVVINFTSMGGQADEEGIAGAGDHLRNLGFHHQVQTEIQVSGACFAIGIR